MVDATEDGVRTSAALVEVLALSGVSKTYPGVRALHNVDFACRAGEVHAIVGENGSGKSTLIKIASGVIRADEGRLEVAGSVLARPTPSTCRAMGLLTAYQDTSLVPELSVAENLVLSLAGQPSVPRVPAKLDARALLDRYDLRFRPDAKVAELSPAARQLLEVVRGLAQQPKVLVLDEPTAAMDATHIDQLMVLLDEARTAGAGIVYISHRLDEVERLADRITVLRDGEVKGCYEDRPWSEEEILNLMVGVPVETEFPQKTGVPATGPAALETADLVSAGFGPVSLSVRAGEIVGLGAAEGNGQRELLRALAGLQPSRGLVKLCGSTANLSSPRRAVAAGVRLISGDRAAEAAFPMLSVMNNATATVIGELGPLGTIVRARERSRFEPVGRQLRMRYASPDQPISELSGGNQQKAVLARAIEKPTAVVLLDEPTMGVDARTRQDIYQAINELAHSGAAILISSSDSAELAGLCNRVYALSRGQVAQELTGDQVSEAAIVQAFVRPVVEAAGSRQRWLGRGVNNQVETLGPRWRSLWLVALTILAFGAFTQAKSSAFLTKNDLSNLFITLLPFAVVALGEQYCLITGGFDMSIGSTMSLAIVVASFIIGTNSAAGAIPGVLAVIALGCLVGIGNGLLIRRLRLDPLIATIATLGLMQGVAIILRPSPAGLIGTGLQSVLTSQIGFLPYAVIVVVLVAVAGDLWLSRTSSGLFLQAAGRSELMAHRNGIHVNRVKYGGFIVCGALAALAGLFLAAQIGTGDNSAGVDFALPAFAGCFIGGAGLAGGRGSFVGALLGSFLLALITDAAPLIGLSSALTQIVTGVLTIVAIVGYSLKVRRASSREAGRSYQGMGKT